MNSSDQPSLQRHHEHCDQAEKEVKDGRYSAALHSADYARKALDPQYLAESTTRCEILAATAHFGLAEDNPLQLEAAEHCAKRALHLANIEYGIALGVPADDKNSESLVLQAEVRINEARELIAAISREIENGKPRQIHTSKEPRAADVTLEDHPTYIAFNKAVETIKSQREMSEREWHQVRITISNLLAAHREKHIVLPRAEQLLADGLKYFCDWMISKGVYSKKRAQDLLCDRRIDLRKEGDLDFEEILIDCLFRTHMGVLRRWLFKLSLIRISWKRR